MYTRWLAEGGRFNNVITQLQGSNHKTLLLLLTLASSNFFLSSLNAGGVFNATNKEIIKLTEKGFKRINLITPSHNAKNCNCNLPKNESLNVRKNFTKLQTLSYKLKCF